MLVLAVLGYLFKDWLVVAIVNGQPITRLAVVRQLEVSQGKQALENLIMETLIKQEAAKRQVTVPPEEVDQRIKELEASVQGQGQALDALLTAQGMTRADLVQQITMQKLVEKLSATDATVSAEAVKAELEKNKDSFPEAMSEADRTVAVREQLEQQQKSETFQTWLDELKKNAKIQYFKEY